MGRSAPIVVYMTTTQMTSQAPETTAQASTIGVRLDFDQHAAGFSRAMAHLDRAAIKELDNVDFDPKLRELVRIRASQLNGCAYCVDMHTKDARAIGETEQRIYALPVWRETPFFTSRSARRSRSPRRSPCSPRRTCPRRPAARWLPSSASPNSAR